MATKFVHKSARGAADYDGNHAGVGVDADTNRFQINPNGTVYDINVDTTLIKTASFTATPEQSGATIIADSTTSVVVTLPPTVAGMKFTLVVGQLTTSGGHAFSPNANDKIIGNGFTPADDKDAVCSAATDVVGDLMELTGDGSLGWYVTKVVGTWARES